MHARAYVLMCMYMYAHQGFEYQILGSYQMGVFISNNGGYLKIYWGYEQISRFHIIETDPPKRYHRLISRLSRPIFRTMMYVHTYICLHASVFVHMTYTNGMTPNNLGAIALLTHFIYKT